MLGQELADGEAVGQVLVSAVGVFPEDFFVIVAVIVGDDFGRGLFASCHRYHYNIKAKKREPWGEALLGEKGLLKESSLLAIFVGFGEPGEARTLDTGLKRPVL